MEQAGKFPEGIIVDGVCHCDFTLVEKTFRTTLEVSNDPTIDRKLMDDNAYYDACLYAKRLKVKGLDKLTPEQVLDLSGPDSDELILAEVTLEKRRQAFRDAAQAASKDPGSPA
ncbi:hypothetical protein GMLC_14580 [Geomonas limicola]|uniref:Uncharacterized protein n=1 Tax=Geomonas limicola TaxID=2740186 RepID=A0A6V8N9E8_9BACT|nr:hypothetical protein [Geomonas limicola]GFO67879.1 hypothetical protein GMLC_14580 [Geomonas limicola]